MLPALLVGLLVTCGILLVGGRPRARLHTLLTPAEAAPGKGSGKDGGDRSGGGRSHTARAAVLRPGADDLAFDLDLVSICLQTGLPSTQALQVAAEATGDRSGLGRLARALALGAVDIPPADPLAPLASLLELSQDTGVSLAPLVASLAADLRAERRRRNQVAAARLGVQLVIPLGACILPAFILLSVVPVVLSLAGDIGAIF